MRGVLSTKILVGTGDVPPLIRSVHSARLVIKLLARSLYFVTSLVAAGCGRGDAMRAEALPPLERPSPEARAGLPEVAGGWRLTGVELATPDTAAGRAAATADAALLVGTQRLDSIAATFRAPGVRLPLVGEVRRDGTLALAGRGPAGESVFFAGHLVGDTLWVEIALPEGAAPWPSTARAAFIRRRSGPRFARLAGGGLLFVERPPPVAVTPAADSAASDSVAADTAAATPVRRAAPRDASQPTPVAPRPAERPRSTPREPAPEVTAPDSTRGTLPVPADTAVAVTPSTGDSLPGRPPR